MVKCYEPISVDLQGFRNLVGLLRKKWPGIVKKNEIDFVAFWKEVLKQPGTMMPDLAPNYLCRKSFLLPCGKGYPQKGMAAGKSTDFYGGMKCKTT